jgi:hypothetical protein
MPKGLASIVTPKNARRLEEIARRGMDLGGPEWYNLEPLRLKFVAEMGEAEGNRLFRRYVDYVAATSPRSKVDANIRRGSYFYGREMQGLPVAELKNPELPKGYGHLAHETQNALLRDLEGGGTFGALSRPKTTSFAENLAGNQRPMTIDTHNMALVVGPKRSPSQTEYRYLEDFQAEIADKLGLTPAQFQASLWVAGDTGVANPRPFMEIFDQVVERTAVKDKKSKEQALKDFITGEAPLFGLGAVMSGLVLQDGVPKAQDMAVGGMVSRAIARLMEAGMTREAAERVVRGEMPPALPDRAPPRLTFSTDNPKAIGAIPNILNFVDDPAYQILEKDLIPELVMMPPDEYISEASRILSRQSPGDIDFDNVVRSRTQDMEYLQGIQDLLDQGADFQVPFLDYKRGGQEGLHRAISARNLGEEQIPVMIMRSAKGDNFIPLTQAEQDAINAAKLEELRAKGYPDPTIEKIMRRELSMNPEVRGYRAYDQGKRTRLYHAGSPELATATELDPDAGRFARAGSGTWMTPDPVLANTYVPAGAENAGTMYEFLVDDSQFPMFVGSGNWDEVIGDLIGPRPEYKTLLEDVSGSTNDIARQVREMGYPGMFFTGISDVGPNYQAAKRSAEMLADRDRMDPKELLEGTIGDRAENPDVYTIFDPSVARSPLAAFDPDQVDSPNLMAGLGPAAIGAGLFGAAMAPEEAEAAGFGTLARAIGRPTQRLFQGSSAKFARPSMQSVGTGTGNQAFGYGLYFTEAPDIAGTYKRGLANKKMIQGIEDQGLVPGVSAGELDDMIDEGVFGEAETRFLSALRDADYLGFDNAHNAAMVALKRGDLAKRYDAANDPAVAELDKIANELGFLYEVEVPEGSFIEWDLPLSEQPEVVQQVVKQNAPPEFKDRIESGQFKGLEAYYLFGKNPEVNSMMWAQYGVPGIRYSSVRTKEGKTSPDAPRNYVIFDENLINIVRRNDEALENNFDELAARASATDIRKPLAATLAAGAAGTTQAEDLAPGEYDAIASERLGQELDRLMQLAEIRRQPSIEPLDDTAMARVGDYLLEDRPSEMDTLQRALQRLDMGQGLGDYFQTTGQGDPTTIMQDLLAGLDIFDVLGLLPGAGKASSAAVRAAQ